MAPGVSRVFFRSWTYFAVAPSRFPVMGRVGRLLPYLPPTNTPCIRTTLHTSGMKSDCITCYPRRNNNEQKCASSFGGTAGVVDGDVVQGKVGLHRNRTSLERVACAARLPPAARSRSAPSRKPPRGRPSRSRQYFLPSALRKSSGKPKHSKQCSEQARKNKKKMDAWFPSWTPVAEIRSEQRACKHSSIFLAWVVVCHISPQ